MCFVACASAQTAAEFALNNLIKSRAQLQIDLPAFTLLQRRLDELIAAAQASGGTRMR